MKLHKIITKFQNPIDLIDQSAKTRESIFFLQILSKLQKIYSRVQDIFLKFNLNKSA